MIAGGIDQYLFAKSIFAWMIYTLLKTSYFFYLIALVLLLLFLDLLMKTFRGGFARKIRFPILVQILLGSFLFIIAGFYVYAKAQLSGDHEPLSGVLLFFRDRTNFIVLEQIYVGAIFLNLLIPIASGSVRPDHLGITRPAVGLSTMLWLGLLGFGTIVLFTVVWSVIYPSSIKNGAERAILSLSSSSQIWYIASVVTVTPLAEELLFRGYLYGAFRERIGVFWGVSIVATAFAFMHGGIVTTIGPVFISGCVLTLIFERCGSLYPGIVLHSVLNMVSIGMMFLRKGG